MQRCLAFEIEVLSIVKTPFWSCPRIRSLGSKSANHLGGMFQVWLIMCETLSSTISEDCLIESSRVCGRKYSIIGSGSEDLKSSKANQHLAVVDQGATYFFPSISKTCAPSGFKAGGSERIVRFNARFCSSQPVGDVTKI